MAVSIQTESGFSWGEPESLFKDDYYMTVPRSYDISPDGERFLMIEESAGEGSSATEFIVVLNWFEELKRFVPTGP